MKMQVLFSCNCDGKLSNIVLRGFDRLQVIYDRAERMKLEGCRLVPISPGFYGLD
jgi:hypothetical protein